MDAAEDQPMDAVDRGKSDKKAQKKKTKKRLRVEDVGASSQETVAEE